MKVLIDKKLLEKTVDTLRDVHNFMSTDFHNKAKNIFRDVLVVKNAITNILIVNPDSKQNGAVKLIDKMLKLEVKIFGEEWKLNTKEAEQLRVQSDRLKNRLLNLIVENKK